MQALTRYNQILPNAYALDNALRAISYSCALYSASVPPSEWTKWLDELKGKASETRYVNRLIVGLPASVAGYFAYGEETSTEATLGRIMAMSMILYHPIEHIWWASTFKTKLFDIDGNAWSQWSCRCWVVYVLCDLIGTLRRIRDIDSKPSHDLKTAKDRRNLLIWLTCILADAPLAIQYSVNQGPFSDMLLNWAGWYGGVAGLYLRWLKLAG